MNMPLTIETMFLTPEEMAVKLRISIRKLQQMMKDGKAPKHIRVGRKVLFVLEKGAVMTDSFDSAQIARQNLLADERVADPSDSLRLPARPTSDEADNACVGVFLNIAETGIGLEVCAHGVDNLRDVDGIVETLLHEIAPKMAELFVVDAMLTTDEQGCLIYTPGIREPTARQTQLLEDIDVAIKRYVPRYSLSAETPPMDCDWGQLDLFFE